MDERPPHHLITTEVLLEQDPWLFLDQDDSLPAEGDKPVVALLERWESEREQLLARSGPLGVCVKPTDDFEDVVALLEHVELVALCFPKFTDGRAYSFAHLLRTRHGFTGQLRAVGDVLHDQLFYMKRCGFDAFELREEKDPQKALEAFEEFSVTYQAAADEPTPGFRRYAF